jgi:hypothetical protein
MLSDEQLKTVIAGNAVGDRQPYSEGDHEKIERHLANLVKKLQRSKRLQIEADFKNYGSGYASYVPVFCYKSKEASTERRGASRIITGISLYLARLAPVAVWGPETNWRSRNGATGGFLSARNVYERPEGAWDLEFEEIFALLDIDGLSRPPREWLVRPLGFEAQIPTILADPPYRVFDALFYWED